MPSRLPPRPPSPSSRTPRPRPRLSTRSQVVRRILLAVLIGISLLLLDRSGVLEQWLGRGQASRLDWANDYSVVEYLRPLVVRRGLTHDARDCLLFIINGNDPPTASRFDVMEKHSGSCPGARGQLPKLFTIKVDRVDHTLSTDAGSPGQFHPFS